MFKRILVPTDGSDITAKAIDTAIGLAKSLGGQIVAMSVKEPFPYNAMSEMQPVFLALWHFNGRLTMC